MNNDIKLYMKSRKEGSTELGNNLVTDSNFINGSASWAETSGVTYTDGSAIINVTSGGSQYIQQSISYTEGKQYNVTADIYCPPEEHNQFLHNNNFSQSVWGKKDVTVSGTQLVQENTNNTSKYMFQNSSVTSGQDYTVSFYVKDNGTRYVQLTGSTGFALHYVNFDIETGIITRNLNNITASISDEGSGWFRISYTDTATSSSSSGRIILGLIGNGNASRVASFAGDGVSGIYLRDAQMDKSSTLRGVYTTTTNILLDVPNSAGNTVRFQDHSSDLGGLLAADTAFTLVEGFNRVSYDFTANGSSNSILISRNTTSGNYTFKVSNVELKEFITTPDSEDTYRLDLSSTSKLNITDSIKQSKDFSTLFAAYSTQFSLPATKANNLAFNRYYNNFIENQVFDARVKVPASIYLQNVEFMSGRLELRDVEIVNGKPRTYKCVFYGGNANLLDRLKDDKLSDLQGEAPLELLNLDSLDIDSLSGAFRSLTDDSQLDLYTTPDVVIPFISHNSLYYADTAANKGTLNSETDEYEVDGYQVINLASGGDSSKDVSKINIGDMRPSVKVLKVLEAVQSKYNFKFSDDFFSSYNREIADLYIQCNAKKGDLASEENSNKATIPLRDLTHTGYTPLASASGSIGPIDSSVMNAPFNQSEMNANFITYVKEDIRTYKDNDFNTLRLFSHGTHYTVGGLGGGTRTAAWRPYGLRVNVTFDVPSGQENEVVSAKVIGQDGEEISTYSFATTGSTVDREVYMGVDLNSGDRRWERGGLMIEMSSPSNVSMSNVRVEIGYTTKAQYSYDSSTMYRYYDFGDSLYSYTDTTLGLGGGSEDFNIAKNLPEMKVLDFLGGLFKMFNLVAISEEDVTTDETEIKVISWNNYMLQGEELDLNHCLDSSKMNVSKAPVHSELEFKFKENDSLLMDAYKETFNRVYGDLELDNEFFDENYTGKGKYSADNKFTKLIYERITAEDSADNPLTNIQWGWSADKEGKSIKAGPLLHYVHPRSWSVTSDVNKVQLQFGSSDVYYSATPEFNNTDFNYYAPSNINYVTGTSINFSAEQESFMSTAGLSFNSSNLYGNYHEAYIENLYHPKTRKYSVKGYMNCSEVLRLKLNNIYTINYNRFYIDKYDANLNTGEVKLDLISIHGDGINSLGLNDDIYLGAIDITTSGIIYFPTITSGYDQRNGAYPIVLADEYPLLAQDYANNNIPRIEITGTTALAVDDVSETEGPNFWDSQAADGDYTLTHTAYNGTGDTKVVTSTVTISGNVVPTAPTITVLGNSLVNLTVGDTYTDAGATASDTIDGNITSSIVTTNNVNTAVAGLYSVQYQVTNSNGLTGYGARTVNVSTNVAPPSISLVGSPVVSVPLGGTYSEAGATASDSVDGNLTSSIVITGALNTSISGTYFKTYTVTNSNNLTSSVSRTIIVLGNTGGGGIGGA